MLFFPLGHEDMVVRRWPWITIALIGLNCSIFLVTSRLDSQGERLAAERASQAFEYYRQHAYLRLKSPLGDLAREGESAPDAATPGQDQEAEQAELDARVDRFVEALHELCSFRYGFIPRDNQPVTLLTHQFLHGGIWHLLGNLWFLWLVGCNTEDGWGRGVFAVFYLTAGLAAALAHKLGAWASPIPMIGASGAIAGAMGAFLLRHGRTRIRILVWFGIYWRIWRVPAFLTLPLWLAVEVLMGLVDERHGSGVAHWAHVGGFGYGLAVALALRVTGTEKKLDDSVENRSSFKQDARLAAAAELVSRGKPREAIASLEYLARREPRNIDIQLELLRAASATGDVALQHRAKARLVELYLMQQMADTALDVYGELVAEQARNIVPPAVRLRIARHHERLGRLEQAAREFVAVHEDPAAESARLPALIGHAQIALRLGRPDDAATLFDRAQGYLGSHPELAPTVREGLARARAQAGSSAAAGHKSGSQPRSP